jgi:hypothetical protein
VIPNQNFYCPHCGAPGQVMFGQAEYSCLCRMSGFGHTCAPIYDNMLKDYRCQICSKPLPQVSGIGGTP